MDTNTKISLSRWMERLPSRAHMLISFYKAKTLCVPIGITFLLAPSRVPPFPFSFFSTSHLAILDMAAPTIQNLDLANK